MVADPVDLAEAVLISVASVEETSAEAVPEAIFNYLCPMNKLITQSLQESQQVLADFLGNPAKIEAIEKAADVLVEALKKGNKILSCGNGGSHCDAMHFAEELTGRYRDKASWATQAEWRQHVSGRWGATAFVGLGGIAPSAGTIIDKGKLLPAGGIGLRYRPFRSNDVQLRVDLAAGKDDHAVYVGIAEAF